MIRIFGHYMSKLFLFLILVEYMVCHVSLYAGAKLNSYYLDSALSVSPDTLHSQASIFALSIVLSMTSVGLYQRGQIMGPSMLLKMAVAFLFASLLLVITFFIFPATYFGREILAWAMASSFIGLTAFRNLFFHIAGAQAQRRRVLVVGTGKNAGLISDLEYQSETFQVISYMYVKDKELVIPFKNHMPEDWILTDYIFDQEIDEIVIAVDDRRKKLPLKEILDCKMMGVEVLDMLGFQEKELFKISIDHLHPSWIFFSTGFRLNFLSRIAKRLFDIFVSLLMLVVFFPVMLLVSFASLLESRFKAPVFYYQDRVGLNGKIFRLHKFRSMVTDAETEGQAQWAKTYDDRVTALGRFIRKTRIDELPQLINILKGEMSIVGPRPERLQFVRHLNQVIPFYDERHRYKPGLAGWAQLRYPYGASDEDTRKKLEYDLYYIKNASIFLDFVILIETIEVVIWGKGGR
jgi:sugar transferase (PEP-CTERM system associated)